MAKRLTINEQLKLLNALPAHRKNLIRKECQKCDMQGQGIGSILVSAAKLLGPIAKEIGKAALKKFILPWVKGKIHKATAPKQKGSGLRLSGQQGSGLKLAGQRTYRVPTRHTKFPRQ